MTTNGRLSPRHHISRGTSTISLLALLLAAGIAPATGADSTPLTNADVVKMLDGKLPESVIIAKIQGSAAKFDTSTDAIIELNKKGVSEKILNAMLSPQSNAGDGGKAAQAEAPTAPSPVAPAGDRPSALSYGTASGLVKRGVTTQREIIDLFGGADVMTTDRDGTEVWMYDKKTTTVSTSGASSNSKQETSEASQMAAFLGIPFFAGVSGAKERSKTDTVGNSQNAGEVKSSSKTITFIIKFNEDKTVKDFAVRQASY